MNVERRPPAAEHWQHLRQLAHEAPVVRNQLMTEAQVAYALEWNHVLQLEANSCVLYPCAGPDVSSPLLVFNPAEIVAIDANTFHVDEFYRDITDHWDDIDHSTQTLPYRIKQYGSPPGDGYSIDGALQWKYSYGSYHTGHVGNIGLERCIAIELKKLGVAPQTISVDNSSTDGVAKNRIEFSWQFPGAAKPTIRVITYYQMTFGSGFTHLLHTEEPYNKKYSAFFQKAYHTNWLFDTDEIDLRKKIVGGLKSGGVVVTSVVPPRTLGREANVRRANSQTVTTALGDDFMKLHPALAATKAMASQKISSVYGWYLIGMKKI